MSAITASVTSVTYPTPPATVVLVRYDDGTTQEFSDHAEMLAHVAAKKAELPQWLKDAALIAWSERNPALTNPAWVNGKTLQLDLSLDLQPLVVGVVI